MPFTFSHPIYALPLKSMSPKYISTTGLVLGSMAPDFEYFLMLEPYRSIGHTVSGLFLQAIPLSILLALIFHLIIKKLLAIHLPSTFNLNRRAYNNLGQWQLSKYKDWLVFIISVTLGFITHVLVDALTHINGFFVNRFSLLNETIIFNYPLYKILQYSLSAFGLLALVAVIIFRLYRTQPNSKKTPKTTSQQKLKFWFIVVATAITMTGLKLAITTSTNVIGILVVAPISGACLGLLLASIIANRNLSV